MEAGILEICGFVKSEKKDKKFAAGKEESQGIGRMGLVYVMLENSTLLQHGACSGEARVWRPNWRPWIGAYVG